jgi:hypothetical protein
MRAWDSRRWRGPELAAIEIGGSAPRTREDIRFERPAHEVGPGAILGARAVSLPMLIGGGRRGRHRSTALGA